MNLLDNVKSKIKAKAATATSSITAPQHSGPGFARGPAPVLGPNDVFRYRKQRGINFGSWFVLEPWITPDPFRNAAGSKQSDLDIVRGKDARAILEHRWDTWITEEDWRWIKDRGFNSIRLPVSTSPAWTFKARLAPVASTPPHTADWILSSRPALPRSYTGHRYGRIWLGLRGSMEPDSKGHRKGRQHRPGSTCR